MKRILFLLALLGTFFLADAQKYTPNYSWIEFFGKIKVKYLTLPSDSAGAEVRSIFLDTVNRKAYIKWPSPYGWQELTGVGGGGTSGDADSLNGQPASYYQKAQYNYLGSLYRKISWTGLTDFTNASSGAAIVSNKIQFTGGTNSYSNYLSINYYTGLQKWTQTVGVKIESKTSTSYGFAIGLQSINSSGSGYTFPFAVQFNSTNGSDSGKIIIREGTSFTQRAISSTGLSFSANDSIVLAVERDHNTFTVKARNFTTDSDEISVSYVFTGSVIAPNTGRFTFYNLGGTNTLYYWDVFSKQPKNVSLYTLVDSKGGTYPEVTSYEKTWPAMLNAYFGSTASNSGAGDKTAEGLLLTNEIIAIQPRNVVIAIGSNDIRTSVATGAMTANIDTIYNRLTAAGIGVYFALMYESSISQSSLISHLTTNYTTRYIDAYSATQSNQNSVASDNVHLTDIGNDEVFTSVVTSGKVTGDFRMTDRNVGDLKSWEQYTNPNWLTSITASKVSDLSANVILNQTATDQTGNARISGYYRGDKIGLGVAPSDLDMDIFKSKPTQGVVGISLRNTSASGYAGIRIFNESGTQALTFGYSGGSTGFRDLTAWLQAQNTPFGIYQVTTPLWYTDNSGNIGYGHISPSVKHHFVGQMRIGTLTAQTDTGSYKPLVVDASGNVQKSTYWYGSGGGGGGMVYPGAGIPLSTGSGWGTSITNNSGNWNTAYSERNQWDGGATGLTASTGRTSLGATTVGSNLFTASNPSAVRYIQINADNTVTFLDAAGMRAAVGGVGISGSPVLGTMGRWINSSTIGTSNYFDDGNRGGFNTTSVPAGVKFQFNGTDGGLQIFRLTTTQRNALGSPPDYTMIQNTTTGKIEIFKSGTWHEISTDQELGSLLYDSTYDKLIDIVNTNDVKIKSIRVRAGANITVNKTVNGSGSSVDYEIVGSAGDPTMGGDMSGTASNAQIVSGAVSSTELATDAVTNVKVANDAINTAEIVNDAVTNAKLANMGNATIKGRSTAGTGDPEDLTPTQVLDLLRPSDVRSMVQTLTDGATITWNRNNGLNAVVTLAGNRTLSITNIVAGDYGTLRVVQDATGSRTLALPAGSKVVGGGAGAITLSTAANRVDVLSFYYDGTNYYWNYGTNYN